MTWASFLDAPSSGEHAVQIYDDLTDLVETVAFFLDAGFQADEPALLVMSADHAHAFEARVESDGWDCAELRRQGLLAIVDAEETLGAFMTNDGPSPQRFRETIGTALDKLAARRPATTVRVFGELVDVLSRRGQVSAAIALEELWNDLSQERRFALLCGYQLDVFDPEVQTRALPEIFRVHSCQRPIPDPARLAAAVDKALVDTVGPREAGNIYLRVAEAVPRSGLPRAQAVLSWLSSADDSTAQQVLSRARALYATA